MVALTSIVRDGQRLIAALKDDGYPHRELFPEPPHTGEPVGVHLLRWTGAELEPVDLVPLRMRGPAVFDLDIVSISPADPGSTRADLRR
ncbi:hypothetical protein [Nannocystis pusilla]|uniref:hypothetical protein n=1 Tax=Nannocystis pusilla TaxID=889268 RepID=UPI003B767642